MIADDKTCEIFINSNREEWGHHYENLLSDHIESGIKSNSCNTKSYLEETFNIQFENRTFELVNYNDTSFKKIVFTSCILKNCIFINCSFEAGQLGCALLSNCNFSRSKFIGFPISISKSDGKNIFYECDIGSSLQGDLNNFNLRRANAKDVYVNNSSFLCADLRGTNLVDSNLAGTNWKFAKIDRFTNLTNTKFDNHPVTRDDSEHIKFSWWGRKWFNWSAIRAIGSLPIFRFSWAFFIFSLVVINTIGYLNETRPVVIEGLSTSIPIPHNLYLIVLSTLSLSIGGFFYSFCCPEKVKSFTVEQWVFEHKLPRIEYISQGLQKPYLLAFTILFLTLGGIIGLYLIGKSVFQALLYVLL
jgi:uncharacterized protein YjbI with pentapeptide repeats